MNRAIWLLIVLTLSLTPSVRAQTPPTEVASSSPTEDQIAAWIRQLDSTAYRQREAASRRLAHAGQAAIPLLAQSIRTGSLEASTRAIRVLIGMTVPHDPDMPDAAYEALLAIAKIPASAKAQQAADALNQLRVERRHVAVEQLALVNVVLTADAVTMNSRSQSILHMRIPNTWSGKADDLRWLAWVYDVPCLVAGGPGIDGRVMRQVARMPNLSYLVLQRAPNLRGNDLLPLATLARLQHVELLYLNLGDSAVPGLSALPLQGSMRLLGLSLSDEQVQQLRRAHADSVSIDVSSGAFLGVSCNPDERLCEVRSVIPGSSADRAGLRPGDIIVRLGKTEITNFPMLQQTIKQLPIGTQIDTEVLRAGQIEHLKVQLGEATP